MNRVPTGIKALDELLGGGFPEGATILISGAPGSGKTIMAQQMMFHNAGPDFVALHLTTLGEPQIKVLRFQQEFSFFDTERSQKYVISRDLGFDLQNGPDQALTAIDRLLKSHHPKLVVIDTIRAIGDMIESSTKYRQFLLDLSLRLATWGSTGILIGEYTEEETNRQPEGALADGIIYLSGTEDRRQQRRHMRIIKMRGTAYTGGEIFFRIGGDGIEAYPRLLPAVNTQTYRQFVERVPTGVQGLDPMLGGGLPVGTSIMVSGLPGSGKTILALHVAYAALNRGERVVHVSFEENPEQLLNGAASLGMDFRPYVASGAFTLEHMSLLELDVDSYVLELQQSILKAKAQFLVIDSVSCFETSIGDERKYADHVWGLVNLCKTIGVTAILTHEATNSGLGTELSDVGISFIVDNVVHLRYAEADGLVKRFLRVCKMRYTDHDMGVREFSITSRGMSVG